MRRRLALLAAACLAVPAVALAAAGDPKDAFTPSDQAKAKSTLLGKRIAQADLRALARLLSSRLQRAGV